MICQTPGLVESTEQEAGASYRVISPVAMDKDSLGACCTSSFIHVTRPTGWYFNRRHLRTARNFLSAGHRTAQAIFQDRSPRHHAGNPRESVGQNVDARSLTTGGRPADSGSARFVGQP